MLAGGAHATADSLGRCAHHCLHPACAGASERTHPAPLVDASTHGSIRCPWETDQPDTEPPCTTDPRGALFQAGVVRQAMDRWASLSALKDELSVSPSLALSPWHARARAVRCPW